MTGYPDNNPKTLVGAAKVPLHLVPPAATHYLALALADGAKKYGPYNWRDSAISVSTYKAAAQRHWDAFWDGEDNAQDSGVHHLAHAMACCALLLDAASIGKLVDDRPTKGAAAKLQREYNKPSKEDDSAERENLYVSMLRQHRTLVTPPVPTYASIAADAERWSFCIPRCASCHTTSCVHHTGRTG